MRLLLEIIESLDPLFEELEKLLKALVPAVKLRFLILSFDRYFHGYYK